MDDHKFHFGRHFFAVLHSTAYRPQSWAYLGPQSRIALVIWTVMGAAFFLYTRRKKAAEKAIDA